MKNQNATPKPGDVDSRDFIAANRITRSDVEMSGGAGKPWFGVCYDFGRWMRTHACLKLWAEWNGRIYHAADHLMAGRMRETPGEVDHLRQRAKYDITWLAKTGTTGGRRTESLHTLIEDMRWALEVARMDQVTIKRVPPIIEVSDRATRAARIASEARWPGSLHRFVRRRG